MTHGALRLPPRLKVWPQMGLALLAHGASMARGLHLMRAADLETYSGRGWLELADVRQLLTVAYSVWTWRHLRRVISDGEELGLWAVDHGRNLRLYGLATVAGALGIDRLRGRPVYIPLEAFLGNNRLLRAHLTVSAESAQPAEGPRARAQLAEETGAAPSTQRRYDKLLHRQSTKNIVITSVWSDQANVKELAWKHGPNIFRLVDHKGLYGPAGMAYAAYELPRSRDAMHETAPRGRMRKVNAKLDPVFIPQRGKSEPGVTYELVSCAGGVNVWRES